MILRLHEWICLENNFEEMFVDVNSLIDIHYFSVVECQFLSAHH